MNFKKLLRIANILNKNCRAENGTHQILVFDCRWKLNKSAYYETCELPNI